MDYFKLMRSQVKADTEIRYGITVHDAYDCDREDCRLCGDFWKDEMIDRCDGRELNAWERQWGDD